MTAAVSMVLFPAAAFDLDWAHATLSAQGLEVAAAAQGLQVRWDEDGPVLRIAFVHGAQVAREAAAIAAGGGYADALRGCDARFEIAIDDLDEALDEMNTLIEVQTTLQEGTGGFLFNDWNGELSPNPSSD
ncbi:hypothetical protein GLE_0516 [Lysobacter enzymogenes]|uniref:Uncharacterized protein n=1 Tax=Lysobacter enzymogenes TaxID=69 RepID=A0A0S2DBH1_LYSEN|nr:hypothetical protein [Lysobacter enzymogenes]ALN55874.1 hypothetical protein GLE_0516 [Lysobacter enzymogenes]UZW60151.1 hypothetical protein BV903_023225 [Lysobacter enzymogenes]